MLSLNIQKVILLELDLMTGSLLAKAIIRYDKKKKSTQILNYVILPEPLPYLSWKDQFLRGKGVLVFFMGKGVQSISKEHISHQMTENSQIYFQELSDIKKVIYTDEKNLKHQIEKIKTNYQLLEFYLLGSELSVKSAANVNDEVRTALIDRYFINGFTCQSIGIDQSLKVYNWSKYLAPLSSMFVRYKQYLLGLLIICFSLFQVSNWNKKGREDQALELGRVDQSIDSQISILKDRIDTRLRSTSHAVCLDSLIVFALDFDLSMEKLQLGEISGQRRTGSAIRMSKGNSYKMTCSFVKPAHLYSFLKSAKSLSCVQVADIISMDQNSKSGMKAEIKLQISPYR